MTFRMFNWVDVRLKASHDLKFCYEPSKKYSKEGVGQITIEKFVMHDADKYNEENKE